MADTAAVKRAEDLIKKEVGLNERLRLCDRRIGLGLKTK